jgi:hypothetical protein
MSKNDENPKKVLSLFSHPRFESKVETMEDEVVVSITPQPKTIELQAARIIDYWLSLGLPKLRPYGLTPPTQTVMESLLLLLKGKHPDVSGKYNYNEIIRSINYFYRARTDENYLPRSKAKIKAVGLKRFLSNGFTGTSYFKIYLNPPKAAIPEKNPEITKCLMWEFKHEKWGNIEPANFESIHLFSFIRAANRLHDYLKENEKFFEPLMKVRLKAPQPAIVGLIACAKQSNNWNNFDPKWLSNDISFSKLDLWLRNQGFFKPIRHTM